MPSTRYTRIEITPEAYMALEAEAILQGKTLKRLASELILKGISKKALDFVQEAALPTAASVKPDGDKMARVIKEIGATGICIDDAYLETLQKILLEKGYQEAMLHIAQHTASIKRDELHRVLTICERSKLPPGLGAEVVKNLNKIESGNW
jgi:hypothetical protein